MIQKTSMTIDAYLRNAGLKSVGTTGRKHFIPLKTDLKPSFSADLASATSSIPPGDNGKKNRADDRRLSESGLHRTIGGLFQKLDHPGTIPFTPVG